MTIKIRIALAAWVAAGVLFVQVVEGYELLSPTRNWGSPPTYRVDDRGLSSVADGDGGATRTVNAIVSSQAWNGAGCGDVVNATKASISGFSLGDSKPMLNFTDPTGACGSGCLAATFTGYWVYDSYLFRYYVTDADIVTNSTAFQWTSQGEDPGGSGCNGEYYVESVMVHEIGHGLALGHTSASGATMLPTIPSCDDTRSSIETDDRNGLRATDPPPIVDQQCETWCEDQWDSCIGSGGQDPSDVQRCDYELAECLDSCMCT